MQSKKPGRLRPPRHFKSVGAIEWVRYSATQPPFINGKKKLTGSRAAGIRYENKVHDYLTDLYSDMYVPSPWFLFKEVGNDRPRWCQPDGLLFLPYTGEIIIVECKLQHTTDAWWQLKMLYLPVIAAAFPEKLWKYGICEVVKWYDCATLFPEKVKLQENIAEVRPRDFAVHIYNGKR